tara:strand:+ start:213 stop:587 length:375 start_codon:yes stop_codon:yes gene_type:complete
MTNIDDLDFNHLDKYSSRSLVAWIKRDVGTQEQRDLVKRTVNTRKQSVQNKIKDRIQINYRLSEDASNKLKQICRQVELTTTYKFLDKSIGLETVSNPESVRPQSLVKAMVESNIEKLWSMTND